MLYQLQLENVFFFSTFHFINNFLSKYYFFNFTAYSNEKSENCIDNLQVLSLEVDKLKNQQDKYYIVEHTIENSIVYGLNSAANDKLQECTRIKIDDKESLHTIDKSYFKCSSNFNVIKTVDVIIGKQHILNIYI